MKLGNKGTKYDQLHSKIQEFAQTLESEPRELIGLEVEGKHN